MDALIGVEALLRNLRLLTVVLHLVQLVLVLMGLLMLVDHANGAWCLILIDISISSQNTVSLALLDFNLSTISILIAYDLLNLSILHISSLCL